MIPQQKLTPGQPLTLWRVEAYQINTAKRLWSVIVSGPGLRNHFVAGTTYPKHGTSLIVSRIG